MGFVYANTEEAKAGDGLRVIVVGGVPSPWGEALKGLLHVKGIDWTAVRIDQRDSAQCDWTGQGPGAMTAPMAFWQSEAPIGGAVELVELAERIEADPWLVPDAERAGILDIVRLCADAGGIGWNRRLQLVHAGLNGAAGFHPKVAGYLGAKYGYDAQQGDAPDRTLHAQLAELAASLGDKAYLCADRLTAADIYSAAFMALFAPLPPEQCDMHPASRSAFESLDAATAAALDPRLLAHRDRIYGEFLALPLSL